MSLHIGHTGGDWWVINHYGNVIEGPFRSKFGAEIRLQLLLLAEQREKI